MREGTWVDRIYDTLGIGKRELRQKIDTLVGPSQDELQDEIDNITANFIVDPKHKAFVDIAIQKDAKLKGKHHKIVEAMLVTYPGVIAVAVHEVAYKLHQEGNIVEAEHLAAAAKARTGIDISPATTIGENLFIDHGTGTVIGETAKVGNNTQIMHKVTLGAYINPQSNDVKDRHPVIGDNCFIGPGTEILGHVVVGNKVNILSKALFTGNKIIVGDGASIRTGAEIEDGCNIAPGVVIGEGAFIHKGSGLITKDVPAHSQVFKDAKGEQFTVDGEPERHRKAEERKARKAEEANRTL